MHYHSPHHGESGLQQTARSQHGETQLPSSTTLPDQPAPLPGASAPAGGASQFDRMQAELKALQKQALATQQSLQQLQSREPVDALTALTSHVPAPPGVDSALLGVGSALVLAGAVVWWFVWQRPRSQWQDAGDTGLRPAAARPMPAQGLQGGDVPAARPSTQPYPTAPDEHDWSLSTASGEFSTHGFEPSSPFARQDPNMAFDSEAAASEVMRVRKSLAEKREARAHLLERDDAQDSARDIDPELDLDLDLDEAHIPSATMPTWQDGMVVAPPRPEPEPLQQAALDLELDLDPWRQPGDTNPNTDGTQPEDAIHFTLALDDYGVKPEAPATPDMHPAPVASVEPEEQALPMQPPTPMDTVPETTSPATASTDYDYTITMELAQESAALELWTEARALATDVLASADPTLVAQARALLERLNQLEQDAPPDTNWSTVR